MTDDDGISQREIDRAVQLGSKFLRTLSTKSMIRQQMQGLGYTEAEHQHGWQLYLSMLGYLGAGKAAPMPRATTEQQKALNRIDHYDEQAFHRSDAALARLHPAQHQYIFGDGLSPKSGLESVGTVKLFLDRYVALRDGSDPARADSREADAEAARTLEARNIVNPQIEADLRASIETVKKLAAAPEVIVASAPEEALQRVSQEFGAWLKDWRATADAGITRRDYRIMLGISKRRSTKSDETEEDVSNETEPPVIAASSAAAASQAGSVAASAGRR